MRCRKLCRARCGRICCRVLCRGRICGRTLCRMLCCLLLALAALQRAAAQEALWQGIVTDAETGGPLAGALVRALDAEGRLAGYAVAGSGGRWSLRAKSLPAHFEVSLLGYAARRVAAGDPAAEYRTALRPEATPIREVTVRAPRVTLRGDTVVYNVAPFAGGQDRSIADVLRKMPGVEVAENGQISYNGEPINRLYVDGSDFAGDRYGLVSNNLPHDDVASVEILENHQPVKALRESVPTDKSAINLRLRQDARASWTGSLRGEAGVAPAGSEAPPLLWSGNLFAMRIASRHQRIETLRSDNTGDRPADDLTSFSLDEALNGSAEYELPQRIAVGTSAAPLDERRTRFNRTHLLSSTDHWQLSEDYGLKSAVSLLDERLTSDYAAQSSWQLADGTVVTAEHERALTHARDLRLQLELTANTERFYLKERLTADLGWRSSETLLTGSYPNSQQADQPRRRLANDLQWVRRVGNRTLTATSRLRWFSSPEELTVLREAAEGGGAAAAHQTIRSSALYTDNNLAFAVVTGRWRITLGGGVRLLANRLRSDLTGAGAVAAPLTNDLSVGYVQPYLLPTAVWERRALRLTLSLPVDLALHRLRNRSGRSGGDIGESSGDAGSGGDGSSDGSSGGGESLGSSSSARFGTGPRVLLRWQLSPRTTLSAGGRITRQSTDAGERFDGALLRNYRYVDRGTTTCGSDLAGTATFGFSYRDPIGAFYAHLTAGYTRRRSAQLLSVRFEGEYILSERLEQPNGSCSYLVTGGLSKGFDALQGIAALDFSASTGRAEQLLQGVLTPYRRALLQLAPRLDLHPARWLRTEYGLTCSRSMLQTEGAARTTRNSLRQRLRLTFTPRKGLSLLLTGEHYCTQLTERRYKQLLLADAALSWTVRSGWELTATASNLFDGRHYAYTLLDDLHTASYRYAIRPRTICIGCYGKF